MRQGLHHSVTALRACKCPLPFRTTSDEKALLTSSANSSSLASCDTRDAPPWPLHRPPFSCAAGSPVSIRAAAVPGRCVPKIFVFINDVGEAPKAVSCATYLPGATCFGEACHQGERKIKHIRKGRSSHGYRANSSPTHAHNILARHTHRCCRPAIPEQTELETCGQCCRRRATLAWDVRSPSSWV